MPHSALKAARLPRTATTPAGPLRPVLVELFGVGHREEHYVLRGQRAERAAAEGALGELRLRPSPLV